jgi:hypothetical protein
MTSPDAGPHVVRPVAPPPSGEVHAPLAIPVRRRLTLLTAAAGIGGALFVPFAEAGGADALPLSPAVLLAAFAFGSACVALLLGWPGLRLADRAQLPMPILRTWELRRPIEASAWVRVSVPSVLAGVAYAAAIVVCVRMLHVPSNPGTVLVRLLTVVFAATVPEIAIHLFAMSGLVRLLRSRWAAILASGVLFVIVFHGTPVGDSEVAAFVMLFNFGFGTLTGWLYTRYGFEAALMTHAIGHAIVLGFN